MLPAGFEEVDNKERRHCGDRGEGGSEDAKLTRRSQGQGTLASEWFSNVFFIDIFQAAQHRGGATMEGSAMQRSEGEDAPTLKRRVRTRFGTFCLLTHKRNLVFEKTLFTLLPF